MAGNNGFPFGSVLQGVGSLVNAFSSIGSAKRNYKRQRQLMQDQQGYNLENMSKQYGYTLDMFNRTNEYNTPENAVKRLRDAGLSPTLAYDGGTLSGMSHMGSTPSSTNPSIPSPQPDSWSSVGAAMSGVGEAIARIKLLNSQAKGQDIDNANKQREYDLQAQYSTIVNSLTEQQFINEQQKEKLLKIDEKTQNLAFEIASGTKDVTIKKAYAEYNELLEQIDLIKATKGKTVADTDYVRESMNNLVADQVSTFAQAELFKSSKFLNEKNARKVAIESGILAYTAENQIEMSSLNVELLGLDVAMKSFVQEHQDKDWNRLNRGEYLGMITDIVDSIDGIVSTFLGQKNHDSDAKSRMKSDVISAIQNILTLYFFRK